MRKSHFFLFLFLIFIGFSCNTKVNVDDYKKNVTGGLNELLVVLPKSLHKSILADSIDKCFKIPTEGIYTHEPAFTIIKTPPSSLQSFLKSHRSILHIEIAKNARNNIFITDEKWAYTQAYAKVEIEDEQTAMELILRDKTDLFNYFKDGEYKRLGKLFKKNPDNKIHTLINNTFGFNLYTSVAYNVNKPSDNPKNFIWLSKEEAKTSQGFFIYSFKYTDKENFSLANLINKRDELLKKHIPGPVKNSYMKTSNKFPLSLKKDMIDNHFAVNLKGYWETAGYFMGGPFSSFAFLNKDSTKVIVIDGYIYGPESNKRNLLTEIEAIVRSIDFAENPK